MTQWRATVGWPGYEVSSDGRVRSVNRVIVGSDGVRHPWAGVELRPRLSRGYPTIKLRRSDGHRVDVKVHKLVLEAFVGAAPPGHEACHLNGVRTDNRVENLRWDTRAANARDTIQHGRNPRVNQTECLWGHRLEPPNLTAASVRKGRRTCLACDHTRSWERKHGRLTPEGFQAQSDERYEAILRRQRWGIQQPKRSA